MSFWSKLVGFFTGRRADSGPGLTSVLDTALHAEALRRFGRREAFSDRQLVQHVLAMPTPANMGNACKRLHELFPGVSLDPYRYRRFLRSTFAGEWIYFPQEMDPNAASSQVPSIPLALGQGPSTPLSPPVSWNPTQTPRTATAPPTTWAPWTPPPRAVPDNPFAAPEILSLSQDEMRKRALRIDPYRTAWIGRVDTIPPQSDERTALIDRGLMLRGLLTKEQVDQIHQVGDIWLKHHDAISLAQAAAHRSVDAALAEMAREKAEAKAEKKRLATEKREQHAAAVATRRLEDIIYLGRGVSKGLNDRRSHIEKLSEHGLPVMSSPADVARALELPIPRLRWLAFHTEAATRTHYVYFDIPKRSGGTRRLAAPHKQLAAAQRFVLTQILSKVPLSEFAHGFIPGRSTVSNAAPHVGRDVVLNLDVKDFFPTITFPRVRGVFEDLGYSQAAATVMALLCTECPRTEVEFDGVKYWVAAGPRALPQGACTSPALSNLVSRKLDRRLAGLCRKQGWVYTRYADDLSFSAPEGRRAEIPFFLAKIRHILEAEGFQQNPRKGRIQRKSRRQSVTGIVVNARPALPRDEVRRLRAILHNAKRHGLVSQNRESHPQFAAWLRGKLAYLAMVDRPRGLAMLRHLDALESRPPSSDRGRQD